MWVDRYVTQLSTNNFIKKEYDKLKIIKDNLQKEINLPKISVESFFADFSTHFRPEIKAIELKKISPEQSLILHRQKQSGYNFYKILCKRAEKISQEN